METDDYINTPKTTTDTWYFAVTNTLKREVMEEVGLEIKNIRYLIDMTFIRPDGTPVVILSFYCNWKDREVKLNEESMDYKWIKPEEAKDYDLIGGLPEEIEMADKILKGKDPDKIEFKL